MWIVSSKVVWKGFLRSLLRYFQGFEGTSHSTKLFYFESHLLSYANYGTFLFQACHSGISLLSLGIFQRILCILSSHSKVFASRLQVA